MGLGVRDRVRVLRWPRLVTLTWLASEQISRAWLGLGVRVRFRGRGRGRGTGTGRG